MGAFAGLGDDLKEMTVAGIIALVFIALVIGFKDSGKVDNSQADLVKGAIQIILAFFGVMALIVIGIRMIKSMKAV
jgi:hypothetical protein